MNDGGEDLTASPRLNEKSRFLLVGPRLTRWRQMQIVVAVFAVATMFGFWQARHDRETRREEQCELTNNSRAGIRDLIDQIVTPAHVDGDPPPVQTPAQVARAERLRALALDVLPPVELIDGVCRPREP